MSAVENLDNKIEEFWPKSGPATQEIKKYVKKYSKEKIVIKCGGRILLDPDLFNNFINDITVLKKLGLTPIVVHGGGPRIKKKLDELNIETKFIMGLRVTDEKITHDTYTFTSRSPVNTDNVMRIYLNKQPKSVGHTRENGEVIKGLPPQWDAKSHTLLVKFENQGAPVTTTITW